MAISEKNIMNRLYLVAGGLFVFAVVVVVKLVDIQMIKKSNSVNDMVIYVLNQYDEAMPLYSVPIGGKPKYHYKLKVNYKF